MPYPDAVSVERFNGCRREVGQLEPLRNKGGSLANLGCDLVNAVLRAFQVQQGAEALRFLHRRNLGADGCVAHGVVSPWFLPLHFRVETRHAYAERPRGERRGGKAQGEGYLPSLER